MHGLRLLWIRGKICFAMIRVNKHFKRHNECVYFYINGKDKTFLHSMCLSVMRLCLSNMTNYINVQQSLHHSMMLWCSSGLHVSINKRRLMKCVFLCSYFISRTSSRCFLLSARRAVRWPSFSASESWVDDNFAFITSSSCFTFSMATSRSSTWHTHSSHKDLTTFSTCFSNVFVSVWYFCFFFCPSVLSSSLPLSIHRTVTALWNLTQ